MRALLVLMLVLVVGGALDAQTFCTLVEETALTGPTASEMAPTLTGDMLTIYFTSTRAGGVGGRDIWMSTRTAIGQPWSTPVNVAALNSTSEESYVTVRPDDLEIYFARSTISTYVNDLYVSTRAKVTDPWGMPTAVVQLNSMVAGDTEDDPSIRADGLEIFFTSDRTGGSGAAIWRSTRTSLTSPWSAPVVVAEIDTTSTEHSAAISGDGLTLIYASLKTGGVGSSDHYMIRRPDLNSPFDPKTEINLTEINTTGWDHNGQQTVDGFQFYFGYNSSYKIYRADRCLPVVHPPLGNPVLGQTFAIYVRRDPGDVTGIIAGSLLLLPVPQTLPGIQGTLELNLGAGFFMAVGMLDKEGRYTTKLPVPNAPVLKGVNAFFQGAVQDTKNLVYLSAAKKVTVQ
ncbi:MAG: PD40 domain-containing protein [Planctomycetes bacterium]|nr:PD40 domain-containing protein [Planctomycetota bacterium]